jgi:hypothetical protein
MVVVLGTFLAGCAGSLPASVAGGECRVFAPPDYAIRGKAQVDQNYIDDFEEAGIAACKWQRPKARPVAAVAHRTVIIKGKPKLVPVIATPVKSTVPAAAPVKKHWWQRLRGG